MALIDGIVMGGGAGVSINASHRVAGERFVFAMPEVGIGFFPDVGGTYFLPRLARRAGVYFALTGLRASPAEPLAFGLVQTFVPSARFGDLAAALEDDWPVDATLARSAADPEPSALMDEADGVEACFALPSRAAIVDALADAERRGFAFASPARAAMLEKSPTSQAIALRQMALGPSLDVHEAMRVEYRIVSRICRGHDFYEGVRALIVDKDNRPKWSAPPSSAELDGVFRLDRRGGTNLPGSERMKHIMRQTRDGVVEHIDPSPPNPSDGALSVAIASVGWETALLWYMRTLAWVWVSKGLFNWAIVLGAFPRLGDFTTMALPLQATIVAFACFNLLAAVGLLLAAPWGGAIWLLCAMVDWPRPS